MKEGYTHISVLLDESGSMDTIKEDTIGGFNTFLNGQKETAKEGDTFTFSKFNYKNKYIYKNARIADVPVLNKTLFRPTGGTALLDAAAESIRDTGAYFASLKEQDRPSKVIFVILTDGEENSSRSTNKEQLNALISEHTNIWKWEFVFIGANQDAIAEGAKYGISALNSMSFGANKLGVEETFKGLTRSLNTYKVSAVGESYASSGAAFTSAERTASMGGAGQPADFSGGIALGGSANSIGGFVGTAILPLTPSKTENVKDDGHTVTVESVSIAGG